MQAIVDAPGTEVIAVDPVSIQLHRIPWIRYIEKVDLRPLLTPRNRRQTLALGVEVHAIQAINACQINAPDLGRGSSRHRIEYPHTGRGPMAGEQQASRAVRLQQIGLVDTGLLGVRFGELGRAGRNILRGPRCRHIAIGREGVHRTNRLLHKAFGSKGPPVVTVCGRANLEIISRRALGNQAAKRRAPVAAAAAACQSDCGAGQ